MKLKSRKPGESRSQRERAAELARRSANAIARQRRGQAPAPQAPADPGEKLPKSARVYRNAANLMRSIFARNDPVKITTDLLQNAGDATKAKVYLEFLEYLYGRPAPPSDARDPDSGKVPVQFVSYIPRPKYPAQTANAASSSGTTLKEEVKQ